MKMEIKKGKNPVSTEKPKRSVELTKKEVARLIVYRDACATEVEAAISMGLYPSVLNRAILVGSASPSTVSKIRNFFTPETIEA